MVTKITRLRQNVADLLPPKNLCIVCGSENVHLWTLDSGRRAAPMYLCPLHEAPLETLLDAAGYEPPSRQKPLRNDPPAPDAPSRAPRRRSMKPLEWFPPEGDSPFYKH
jgi:hypothetical protein